MSETTPGSNTPTPFELTHRWATVSQNAITGWLRTGRAALTAFDGTSASSRLESCGTEAIEEGEEELACTDPEWVTERSVESPGDLSVGDFIRFTKTFSDDDVVTFAFSSGDTNRLHLEESYADGTRFGGRILHGTLVAGTISAALARLPGLTVYLSQNLEFHAPVEPGEAVTAEVSIVEALDDNRYRLSTLVSGEDDQTVIDGEAIVLVDEHPDD